MKTIYKYDFRITDRFEIKMPSGANIIHVKLQRGNPYLWAMVDTNRDLVSRFFAIFETGKPMEDNLKSYQHLGSFQQWPFVWHLFEIVH
jgi:hypothetical protein